MNQPTTYFWKDNPVPSSSQAATNEAQEQVAASIARRRQQENDPAFLGYIQSLSPELAELAKRNLGEFKLDGSPILTLEDLAEKILYVQERLAALSAPKASNPVGRPRLQGNPAKDLEMAHARKAWKDAVLERDLFLSEIHDRIRILHAAYMQARTK